MKDEEGGGEKNGRRDNSVSRQEEGQQMQSSH